VSSILKALKKLESGDFHHIREPETESAETSDFAHPRLRRTDIKKTIRQQAKGRQRLNRLVSIAAVLLIVFGGMWLLLTQKQKLFSYSHSKNNAVDKTTADDSQQSVIPDKTGESISPARNKSADQKQDKAASPFPEKPVAEVKAGTQESVLFSEKTIPISEPAAKNIRDPEKADKSQPILGAALKTEVEKPVRLPEKTDPLSVPPVIRNREPEKLPLNLAATVRPEVEKPVRVSEKTAFRTESSVKKPEKADKSQPSFAAKVKPEVEKPVRLPEKTAPVSVPPVTRSREPEKNENVVKQPSASAEPKRAKEIADPRLKLQALVWSGDPEKRLAVVNDRIVKTGALITDTIAVTYIGSDYITVREGNKEWEVKFKIK